MRFPGPLLVLKRVCTKQWRRHGHKRRFVRLPLLRFTQRQGGPLMVICHNWLAELHLFRWVAPFRYSGES